MSSDDLDDFWVHIVNVHTYQGKTGDSVRTYSPPLNADGMVVNCFLERKQQFIRNQDGEQVLSQAVLFADVSYADAFKPQSVVDIDGQASTTVLQRTIETGGQFIDDIDYVQAYLQ